MNNIARDKSALRKKFKEDKAKMQELDIFRENLEVNRSLALFLAQQLELKRSKDRLPLKVCSYLSMPDELDLAMLMSLELTTAVEQGDISFYIPRIVELNVENSISEISAQEANKTTSKITDSIIEFAEYKPSESVCQCQKNHYGIQEPELSTLDYNLVPDIILTPAMAIDSKGHRLGRGKAFYDRYITKARKANPDLITVAVIYSVQFSHEEIPSDEYDQKMDYVAMPREDFPLKF